MSMLWLCLVLMVASSNCVNAANENGQCEEGWVSRGTFCYKANNGNETLSWEKARYRCQDAGADLVSIEGKSEMDFIVQEVLGYTCGGFWIGLSKLLLADRGWMISWSDNTTYNYTFFEDDGHEPFDKTCFVIAIDQGYRWVPDLCHLPKKWICKKNKEEGMKVFCTERYSELHLNITDSYPVYITSPNFPFIYPADVQCTWIIKSVSNITVTFQKLALLSYLDAIIISDGIDPNLPSTRSITVNRNRLIESVTFPADTIWIQAKMNASRRDTITSLASLRDENIDTVTPIRIPGVGFRMMLMRQSLSGDHCTNNSFSCGNGICVLHNATCNGINDCGNMADEQSCNKPFEFWGFTTHDTLPTCVHWNNSHNIFLSELYKIFALKSPYYPLKYPNYLKCTWFMNTAQGSVIRIAVIKLELQGTNDRLLMGEGNVTGEHTFVNLNASVGSMLRIDSNTNNVWMNFISDAVIAGSGFFLIVQRLEVTDDLGGCLNSEFACLDGSCIGIEAVCDKNADCSDGKDEYLCECTSTNQQPHEFCSLPLGMEDGLITDSQIEASSSYLSHEPWRGRLNTDSYWVPTTSDHKPELQVTFRQRMIISAIAFRPMTPFYIEAITLKYPYFDNETNTEDTEYLNKTLEVHNSAVIDGTKCPEIKLIVPSIQTTTITMILIGVSNDTRIGIQIEYYGCLDNECSYRAEKGSYRINSSTTSYKHDNSHNDISSSNIIIWQPPYHATGWLPVKRDSHPWLQIEYWKGEFQVGAIVTQGCGNYDYWVINYTISYTSLKMNNLADDPKLLQPVFDGNFDRTTRVWNYPEGKPTVTILRINPISWQIRPCMRLEVLGCHQDKDNQTCGIFNPANTYSRDCTLKTAIIQSPNFPFQPPLFSNWYWHIKVAYDEYIFLKFLTFDFPNPDGWECQYNYLKIYDDTQERDDIQMTKICNENFHEHEDAIMSRFNKMTIKLPVGGHNNFRGFQVKYAAAKFRTEVSNEESLNGQCPDDWILYRSSCYLFVKAKHLRWTEARRLCTSKGDKSNLVSIHDQEESDFIHRLLIDKGVRYVSLTYIGLFYNHSTKARRWSDGRPLSFTDWSNSKYLPRQQPDDSHDNSCSAVILESIYSTREWHDIPCAMNNIDQYICEKPAESQIQNGSSHDLETLVYHSDGSNNDCQMPFFTCQSGDCIHQVYVCDGELDCFDGSDEDTCRNETNLGPVDTCPVGYWRCNLEDKCLPISLFCDFIPHCKYGTDEDDCEYRTCSTEQFKCTNGQCINESQRCDLIADCFDESDEFNCENKEKGFQCFSGFWIPLHAKCNHQIDCGGPNYEDEEPDCANYEQQSMQDESNGQSREGIEVDVIQCKNGATVDASYRCIYGVDKYDYPLGCPDATQLENCGNFTCNSTTFKCAKSYCIPVKNRCDGVWDCPNGEDETACGMYVCEGRYHCHKSTNCIIQSELCNGIRDCPNGDDELFCDLTCPSGCDCNGLSYQCYSTEWNEEKTQQIPIDIKSLNVTRVSNAKTHSRNNASIFEMLYLNISHYKLLIVLDLSSNGISNIGEGVFVQNANLKYLSLAWNDIAQLLSGAFEGLSSLQQLILQGNLLIRIDPEAFISLTKLIYLNIQQQEAVEDTNLFHENLTSLDVTRPQFPSLVFLYSSKYLYCCFVDLSVTECLPEADQFSSCSDLMRIGVLRVSIWILGLSALLGNAFVIFWRVRPGKPDSRSRNAVQSILVLNLAIADGLMGIYMLIIASADLHYRDDYIMNAESWKKSLVCKLAGLLSVLSSEASVLFLTVISFDRWLSITFPFSFKRLNKKSCIVVVLTVWGTSLVLSSLPLLLRSYFGNNFYGSSSVCLALPLSQEKEGGWQYSVALFLGVNLLAFVTMAFCYISIYITAKTSSQKIQHRSGNVRAEQLELATRMAFLVFTDLLCWMPIIIMGLLSVTGVVSIPGDAYVWIAVFVLPVNSSLNPYLYTILTRELARRKGSGKSKQDSSDKSDTDTLALSSKRHNSRSSLLASTCRLIPYMDIGKLEPYRLSHYNRDKEVFLNQAEVLAITRDLKNACSFLCQHGIVHGAITEDYVFVEENNGEIKGAFLMLTANDKQVDSKEAPESDQLAFDNERMILDNEDMDNGFNSDSNDSYLARDELMLEDVIIRLNEAIS